jgi:hypothetical protein
MTADWAGLEARVSELEQQMRNVLPYKIDAVAFGVSVMHREVMEQLGEHGERLSRIELQLGEHGERLDSIDQRLDSQSQALTDHGHMLAEILRRLPNPETGS